MPRIPMPRKRSPRSRRHGRRGFLVGAGLASLAAVVVAGSAIAASASNEARYIVLYEDGVSVSKRAAIEENKGNDVQDVFRSAVKGIVADLEPSDVSRLRQADGVELVERDRPVEASAFGARDSSSASWGLDRADQRALPLNSRISTAENGYGVTAYIIDTGIRADHEDFGGRVSSSGFDAMSDGQNSNDCNGHGTHVAGTVGGTDFGVAPEVKLVPVRVLDCSGSGWTSGVIAGVDWATQNHQPGVPAVANMSLGGGFSSALNQAVANAVADGIVMAVAAGNSNQDACNYSPASAPSAITVAASNWSDSRASFSNYGSCADIYAPGVGITSAWIGSSISTNTISGTSMASPHVAGAAALALSANPSLTSAQVASQLSTRSTTGVISDPGAGTPNHLLYVGDPGVANPVPDPDPITPPPPGPPPVNDNFSGASALNLATGASGTNLDATLETGEPAHVAPSLNAAHSVWWSWTAPSNGTLDLSTFGSNYDTLLAVYEGASVSSLTLQAGNDDAGTGQLWSQISLPVQTGKTYRIAVDGWNGRMGSISLSGSFASTDPPPPPPPAPAPAPAPANDDFADARALDSLAQVTGTTVDSTHEAGEPAHAGASKGSAHSIWYRWTAPSDGDVVFSTEGSDFDTLLAAYSGSSVSGLSELASSDDAGGGHWSLVSFPVTGGVTYQIAVDGWSGRVGNTVLSGAFAPAPAPPDPVEPPDADPVEGVLAPTGGTVAVGTRGAVVRFACSSPEGQTATDGCDALVRLSTRVGSTRRSLRMELDATREVRLPVTAKMRRAIARNGLLSATLTVVTSDGSRTDYRVILTARNIASSRGKR